MHTTMRLDAGIQVDPADIVHNQRGCFLKATSVNQVGIARRGDLPVAVLLGQVEPGVGSVQLLGAGGVVPVRCGGDFGINDPLTVDELGRAVKAAPGEPFYAVAFEPAAGVGGVVDATLQSGRA